MIGYFEAVDSQTGETIGKYKYSTVSDAAKVWLRRNLDHFTLRCCCNDNHVEMKISSDLKIYPAKNETGLLHEKSCPKYPDINTNLWRIQKEGNLYYNVASPDANAKDYALKINDLTAQSFVRKGIIVDDYKVFNKRIYHIMNYVKNESGILLKDIYSARFKDVGKLESDVEVYVYGILRKIQKMNFLPDNILYMEVENIFGDIQPFYIDRKTFTEFYNASRARYYQLLVSAFAYKKNDESKILTISDFYLTTMGKDGIIF